jgi:hypothetical protein
MRNMRNRGNKLPGGTVHSVHINDITPITIGYLRKLGIALTGAPTFL